MVFLRGELHAQINYYCIGGFIQWLVLQATPFNLIGKEDLTTCNILYRVVLLECSDMGCFT